jgi:hypothetical protein
MEIHNKIIVDSDSISSVIKGSFQEPVIMAKNANVNNAEIQ